MARPRSDIRPRVLEAARARFLLEGVDGASLRAIAADADTSVGMIHYYFPTKDELFLAVVEDIYAAMLADMATALAPDVPVEARLRRLYARLGAMTATEAATLRLIIREALVSSARLARIVERFRRGHVPLMVATITDGMRAGVVRTDVPPLLLGLVTFALGAVPPVLARQAGASFPTGQIPQGPALGEALMAIVLGGISAGPARTAPRTRRARRPAATSAPAPASRRPVAGARARTKP